MNLQQLRENLKKGFYVDNLYEIASLCDNLALDTASPAPFFVLEQIFLGIAKRWADSPVTVEEAGEVEERLAKQVDDLVEGIEQDSPSEVILSLLDEVLSAYLNSFE